MRAVDVSPSPTADATRLIEPAASGRGASSRGAVVVREVATRYDESPRVTFDSGRKPVRVGCSTDQDEKGVGARRLDFTGRPVWNGYVLEPPGPPAGNHLGVRTNLDVAGRFEPCDEVLGHALRDVFTAPWR